MGGRNPLLLLGGLLVLYLGVPIVAFCVRLIATSPRGFHDPGLFSALAVSALAASITTTVATLCGVPLAYLLARSKSRLATGVGVAMALPIAVPPVMGGVLLVYLVGPYTWLGHLFGGHLTGSLAGIVLAQTFVASPFLVIAAWSSLSAVEPALGDVAATLGHGQLARFLLVDVAVAAPGIRAGMLLTWLRAFGEYGATVVLAYHPTSLPVYTFTQFSATGLPGTMAPTALALGVAGIAVMVGRVVQVRLRRRPWSRGGDAAPAPAPHGRPVPSPHGRPVPSPHSPVAFDLDHRLGTFHLGVGHRPASAQLAVLGPSGSGKSTLLRCLAGLHGAGPGAVSFGDRRVERVPVERRRVGYVAQSFGLFPNKTVWEQLLFAVDADPAIAAYWLEHLRLSGLEHRYPHELSGGQRQRVALAQALSRSPDVLLLDEPFSALDTPVRHELQRELRQLQQETGVATVLVTHDPEEAAFLAEDVLVLDAGRALQDGPVRTVYTRPMSPEVARLVGVANLCPGLVVGRGVVRVGNGPTAETTAAETWTGETDALHAPAVFADTGALAPGTPVLWSVRPEVISLSTSLSSSLTSDEGPTDEGPTDRSTGETTGERSSGGPPRDLADEVRASARLVGEVVDVAELGWVTEVLVAIGSPSASPAKLRVRCFDHRSPALGERCTVEVPAAAVSVWPAAPHDRGGAESGPHAEIPLEDGGRVLPSAT